MWILKVTLLSVCLFIVFARPEDSTSSDEDDSGSDSDETTESIVEHTESVGKDGSYNYSYETSNGIKVEQYNYVKLLPSGRSDSADSEEEIQVQQGSYSYTAPDGTVISLSYTADENGFQPEGDHLPTLSPIADILLKKQLSEDSDDSDSKDSDGSEESGKHRKGKSNESDDDEDSDDNESSENSKSQDEDDDDDSGSNGKSDDKD